MKTILLSLFASCLLAFMPAETPIFVGTYGASASDPVQIQLSIHADHSFVFIDHSHPRKKINASGTWTENGNKVILKDPKSKHKFHQVWTFHNEGKQAKSREGMTYYTLCRNNK